VPECVPAHYALTLRRPSLPHRIILDERSSRADKDRAERMLLQAQTYDMIKLSIILLLTVVVPLLLVRRYGALRDPASRPIPC
jgi:hypothetical protein